MNRVNISIFIGTFYCLLYAIAIVTPQLERLSEVLWLLSPALIILVAFFILTSKEKYTGRKFTEYFYQDEDIRRNVD